MLSEDELRRLIADLEADHVERTVSTTNSDKFGEAICSFANDLPDRRAVGVLFVGLNDNGSCGNIDITEQVMQRLASFRSDGNIMPPPMLHVRKQVVDNCALAIVEVTPSTFPPLRYKGRVCVRVGPRRGFASAEEERALMEKRVWGNLSFDRRPIQGATILDIDPVRFANEVLPACVHPEALSEDTRSAEQQMQALGLVDQNLVPTASGLLTCGKDPRAWLPGAYVQFVRYPGTEIGEEVADQKEIGGALPQLIRRVDEVVAANIAQLTELSKTIETSRPTYPRIAIQEILRNAIIHRNYEGTASPVMISWFSDRIEVTSPGGPFGAVTITNFGLPGLSDARNPSLATFAKSLGYVQRFGSGIPRAKAALATNNNPEPEFSVEQNFVNVTLRLAK